MPSPVATSPGIRSAEISAAAQTALGNAALTRGIHLTAEQAVAERNAEPAYFRSGDGWQEAEVIGA